MTIVNTMDRHDPAGDLTIGVPTPGNAVYVLDEALRPLPRGQPGLMWAGGRGVSLGYLNRPALTAERYRPDPYALQQGCASTSRLPADILKINARLLHRGVMYNTGDLGRVRSDGRIEHLGRVDDQVKVKVRMHPSTRRLTCAFSPRDGAIARRASASSSTG